MATQLVEMSKLAEYLQLAKSSSESDPVLVAMNEAISAFIERYCDRTFANTSYTEYYDIVEHGQDELVLNQWPVTNATADACKVYSISWADGSETATELDKNEDYWIYADEGIIKFAADRWQGKKRIKAVYQAGYTTVPLDIQQVVMQWCGRRWVERKHIGKGSDSTPAGGSVSYNQPDLTTEELMVLDAYRRVELC